MFWLEKCFIHTIFSFAIIIHNFLREKDENLASSWLYKAKNKVIKIA